MKNTTRFTCNSKQDMEKAIEKKLVAEKGSISLLEKGIDQKTKERVYKLTYLPFPFVKGPLSWSIARRCKEQLMTIAPSGATPGIEKLCQRAGSETHCAAITMTGAQLFDLMTTVLGPIEKKAFCKLVTIDVPANVIVPTKGPDVPTAISRSGMPHTKLGLDCV